MRGVRRRVGNRSRASSALRWLFGSFLLSGLLVVPPPLLADEVAATRTITLRWRHQGKVAGFKVYTRHVDLPYDKGIDIGLPKKVDGVFSYRLEVSNLDATYVSITAYARDGTESFRPFLVAQVLHREAHDLEGSQAYGIVGKAGDGCQEHQHRRHEHHCRPSGASATRASGDNGRQNERRHDLCPEQSLHREQCGYGQGASGKSSSMPVAEVIVEESQADEEQG